jgi:hypothetical protein
VKFRFSLQKALEWTESEESALKLEIARLLKQAEGFRSRLGDLDSNLSALLGNVERTLALEWAPYVAAKIPLDARERREVETRLQAKQAEIGMKKAELNRCLLKRKGLESLRGKRLKDFRMGEARRDQKRLDDNYQLLKLRVKNG